MNIYYITNSRIPTEKAYGLQTASMCAALAGAGANVVLMAPKRKNTITKDVFSYYGVLKNFTVEYISIIDAIGTGKYFGFGLTRFSYLLSLFAQSRKWDKQTIILTRDHVSGWLLARRGFKVFYDMHGFPISHIWLWKRAMAAMAGIICTNEWKMRQCRDRFGIPKERLMLCRNGFDASLFADIPTKERAREQLGFSPNDRIAVYTGHLYDWKGAHVLARAGELLLNTRIIFVGGTSSEVRQYREKFPGENMEFVGNKPHNEIPAYLAAADVLVLPNSAQSKEPRYSVYSQYDTSPLKLFEYMAAGRPIVASALPSIKEVLHNENAVLVAPDDPQALAAGIEWVFKHPEESRQKVRYATEAVGGYTWDRRARSIISFMQTTV